MSACADRSCRTPSVCTEAACEPPGPGPGAHGSPRWGSPRRRTSRTSSGEFFAPARCRRVANQIRKAHHAVPLPSPRCHSERRPAPADVVPCGMYGAGRPKNLVAGVRDPARSLSSGAGRRTGECRRGATSFFTPRHPSRDGSSRRSAQNDSQGERAPTRFFLPDSQGERAPTRSFSRAGRTGRRRVRTRVSDRWRRRRSPGTRRTGRASTRPRQSPAPCTAR